MKPILHNGKGGAFREKSEVKPCSFLCLYVVMPNFVRLWLPPAERSAFDRKRQIAFLT